MLVSLARVLGSSVLGFKTWPPNRLLDLNTNPVRSTDLMLPCLGFSICKMGVIQPVTKFSCNSYLKHLVPGSFKVPVNMSV